MTGFERYRRKKLLSQVQLAKVLGVTAAAVSSWETRKSIPHAVMLKRLASMYGVTVDDLLRTDYPDNDLDEQLVKEA